MKLVAVFNSMQQQQFFNNNMLILSNNTVLELPQEINREQLRIIDGLQCASRK